MDKDIDKLKKIVSKQDAQIKQLLKVVTKIKQEYRTLKIEVDHIKNSINRSR
jgi:regulator of replication initiation timing